MGADWLTGKLPHNLFRFWAPHTRFALLTASFCRFLAWLTLYPSKVAAILSRFRGLFVAYKMDSWIG
jgi:hypothetical protein